MMFQFNTEPKKHVLTYFFRMINEFDCTINYLVICVYVP